MPPEIAEALEETLGVAGSDEVTDAEYEAWVKGEEPQEEEPAEAAAEEEPSEEGEPEPEPVAEEIGEEEGETEASPKKDQTPEWARKRFSTLAQQRDAAAERAAAAEARAAAAEALLAAQGKETSEPVEGDTSAPKTRTYTQAELDAEATKRAEQISEASQFNSQCNTLFEVGAKEFGEEAFDANLQNLRDVGILSPTDLGFVRDALETESPAKVLYHLGQNPDEAMKIAGMSATKRAVALDRLAAQLTQEKPKTAKPLSKVPAPIAPVTGARGRKEIDINDPGLSDEDAFAEFERLDRQRIAG